MSNHILRRVRRFIRDERGAGNAVAVIASVVVFGIVSTGIGATLTTGMETMQASKVNTALAAAVSDAAQRTALRGYTAVTEMNPDGTIDVAVGNTTVTANLTISVDEASKTAIVNVSAGKYTHGTWEDPDSCVTVRANCVAAKAIAVPTLAQSMPTAPGVQPAGAGVNLPADEETRFVDAATSQNLVFAIDEDRHLWAWGSVTGAGLGHPTATELLTPTRIGGDRQYTSVEAGRAAGYAIDTTGALYAWGEDGAGQQGNGATTGNVWEPTRVGGDTWKQVSAEDDSVCAITTDGKLYCWGEAGPLPAAKPSPTRVQLPDDPATSEDERTFRFTTVAVGTDHVAAVDEYGDVWTWGSNSKGQLGVGATPASSATPVKVTKANTPIGQAPIATVAVGSANTYAIDVLGRMWGWGDGAGFKVGDGTTLTRNTPVRIGGDRLFATVTGGINEAFATTLDGTLYAWGAGATGKTGVLDPDDPTGATWRAEVKEPTRVDAAPAGDKPVRFITVDASLRADSSHVVALDATHRLWIWGPDAHGAVFGDGNNKTRTDRPAPVEQLRLVKPSAVNGVIDAAAGAAHSVTLNSAGRVSTWGAGGAGQLGNGSTSNTNTPVTLGEVTATDRFVGVSAGDGTIAATTVSGGLFMSGRIHAPAATDTATAPTQVAGVAFSQAGDQTTGVSSGIGATDGQLYVWGDNTGGVYGNNTTTTKNGVLKVAIPASPRIVDAAVGQAAAFAVDEDGKLWSWGTDGEVLGQGDAARLLTPKQVAFPAEAGRIVAVSASATRAIALDEYGAAYTWGVNAATSPLGAGSSSSTTVTTPTRVNHPTSFVQVEAGATATFGLTAGGDLYGWGSAATNGTGAVTATPVKLLAGVQKVAAGNNHALALTTDGRLLGWGSGTGTFAAGAEATKPTLIRTTTGTGHPAVAFTDIAAAADTSAALTRDGAIWAAGRVNGGSFGDTSTDGYWRHVPAWAGVLGTVTFTATGTRAIDAGGDVTVAVNKGVVWAWGAGYGAKPTLAGLPAGQGNVAVSQDGGFIIATDQAGTVWQVGAHNPLPASAARRLPAPASGDILDLDAGGSDMSVVARRTTTGTEVTVWGQATPTSKITQCASAPAGFPCTYSLDAQRVGVADGTLLWVNRDGVLHRSGTGQVSDQVIDVAGAGAGGRITWSATRTGGQLAGHVTSGTHPDRLPDTSASIVRVEVGGNHAIGVDSRGRVWTWGQNGASPALAAPTTPGTTTRLVGAVDHYPHTHEMPWQVATLGEAANGLVQVNVDTDLPVQEARVMCGDTITDTATFTRSSGDYRYANLDLAAHPCTDGARTLMVQLNGWPARDDELAAVVLPLVKTDERTPPGS